MVFQSVITKGQTRHSLVRLMAYMPPIGCRTPRVSTCFANEPPEKHLFWFKIKSILATDLLNRCCCEWTIQTTLHTSS